ncbi:MAG: 5'-nucleotidase [Planctomycetota bacterium]|jgi:5'-nucleotidase
MPNTVPHFLGAACALLMLAGLMSPPTVGQDAHPALPPWRILVTNDDGIETKALAQLVAALGEHGEVVVCAPDGNRSGSSHSVRAWTEPMAVKATEVEGASLAFAVGGSPADAVAYGLLELGKQKPFDLVVSGINEGANVGELSHYSGTVGAAMEAVYRGVPAVAVSQGGRTRDYAFSARFTANFVAQLRAHGTRPGVVYSINVPGVPEQERKGVALRPMGGSYLVLRGWTERKTPSGQSGAVAKLGLDRGAPAGSDSEAYNQGYVTITPLQFDWTDRAALLELGDWDLDAE